MISICIPVYNGARYIGQTLESLSRQTYDDFEVVVSDNASTDDTETVVRSLSSKFKRFTYSRNEKNIGYSSNVSKAVSIAESEIVAIYHADDIYQPDILKREFEVLQSDSGIAGVFARSTYYRTSGTEDEDACLPAGLMDHVPFNPAKKVYIGGMHEFGPALLRFGNFFVCPSFMTRKQLFLSLGGFTDQYPTNEDLHLWIRYMDAGHSLAIIDEPLLRYRISQTQGSASLRKHLGQSICYSVMDDLLIDRFDASFSVINDYKEQKAIDLFDAAVNSLRLGKLGLAFTHIKESRRIMRLRGFSRKALAQRMPCLGIPAAIVYQIFRERVFHLNS